MVLVIIIGKKRDFAILISHIKDKIMELRMYHSHNEEIKNHIVDYDSNKGGALCGFKNHNCRF